MARTSVAVSFDNEELSYLQGHRGALDLRSIIREGALTALGYYRDRAIKAAIPRETRTVGVLTDHACYQCGGRIVRVLGHGPTPGGNPVIMCSACGRSAVQGLGDGLCWCDYMPPRSGVRGGVYMCVPYSILDEKPWLKLAFEKCGNPPGKTLIGVMLAADYRDMKPDE